MRMDRAFLARVGGAAALWTLFVLGLLLLYPWRLPMVPCARLVGTPETRAACEPLIAAATEQVFAFQQLPFLAVIASGYFVIVLLEVRRRR